MSGVPVLAAIWSAVPLPSGAVSAFALTEQDPPFLSHVVAEKSSEYFAMFSYGPPADPNGPHSMEFRCESRYAHRLLAAAYAKFAPPDPSRRTTVPAVAFAVASVICEDVCVWTDAALPARSVTRPVISACACVWVSGALPARSVVRLVTSASAWVWPGTDASAMVTFTRSLAGTSRNVSPMFAPWIRFNARRVPTAAPLFWIENGSDPDTMSAATCVWLGRSPAARSAPAVVRPHESTVTLV